MLQFGSHCICNVLSTTPSTWDAQQKHPSPDVRLVVAAIAPAPCGLCHHPRLLLLLLRHSQLPPQPSGSCSRPAAGSNCPSCLPNCCHCMLTSAPFWSAAASCCCCRGQGSCRRLLPPQQSGCRLYLTTAAVRCSWALGHCLLLLDCLVAAGSPAAGRGSRLHQCCCGGPLSALPATLLLAAALAAAAVEGPEGLAGAAAQLPQHLNAAGGLPTLNTAPAAACAAAVAVPRQPLCLWLLQGCLAVLLALQAAAAPSCAAAVAQRLAALLPGPASNLLPHHQGAVKPAA